MTNYNVPGGTFTYANTLTAATADTVQFADRAGYVTVTNTGSTVMCIRGDGQAATVAGEGCYVVLPGESAILANGLPIWYQSSRVLVQGGSNALQQSKAGQLANPGTTVSVISSAAESYVIAFAG